MPADDPIPYAIGSKHWPGLSKLTEEMGELQQVLGKLIATGGDELHWDGSNLVIRLVEEMGDVYAALDFFQSSNLTLIEQAPKIAERKQSKFRLFVQWHIEQRIINRTVNLTDVSSA